MMDNDPLTLFCIDCLLVFFPPLDHIYVAIGASLALSMTSATLHCMVWESSDVIHYLFNYFPT